MRRMLALWWVTAVAAATNDDAAACSPRRPPPRDAPDEPELSAVAVDRATVGPWVRSLRHWVKRWDARAPALATLAAATSTLCVPPKSGSTALFRRYRGGRRLDRLPDADVARAIFDLPPARRVAVVRHPVVRAVSAFRAGRVHDERENKGLTLDAFASRLACDSRLPCAEQRRRVNQHWRSQRCFCAFDIPGVRARTSVYAFRDADAALAAAGAAPGPSLMNAASYSAHSTLTPRTVAKLRETYGNATIDSLYAAVAPDLEYFRDLWPERAGDAPDTASRPRPR